MKDAATKEYLKMYSCPQTFSNALSPVQVAVVRAALGIVKSAEGATRRQQLLESSHYLCSQLAQNGFTCLGEATPMRLQIIS
jgi:7-keto-8-aminopelargonate synthetase-like enzyme